MTSRSFSIPIVLASIASSGCSGFQFESTWDALRAESTVPSDPTLNSTIVYPLVEGDTIDTVYMEVGPTTLELKSLTMYSSGAPESLNTDGPYEWAEVDGRFEVTGDFDADSFICDPDEADDHLSTCTITFDPGTEDEASIKLFFDRRDH